MVIKSQSPAKHWGRVDVPPGQTLSLVNFSRLSFLGLIKKTLRIAV